MAVLSNKFITIRITQDPVDIVYVHPTAEGPNKVDSVQDLKPDVKKVQDLKPRLWGR